MTTITRVTVNLTERTAEALDKLAASTGDTKTDCINKALQIYAHVQDLQDRDGRLYSREPGSDDLERLRFL